jgi:hypothetical protein
MKTLKTEHHVASSANDDRHQVVPSRNICGGNKDITDKLLQASL